MKLSEVLKLKSMMHKAAQSLVDEDALEAPRLFEAWEAGKEYETGTRVRFGDELFRCLTPHTSSDEWTTSVPSLWAKVLPGQEGTTVGEWVQPDSTNPYMTGDKVTHNGKTWVSTADNNVWTPGVYGWIEVTDE